MRRRGVVMKRFAAWTIGAIAALALAAGCGGSTSNSGGGGASGAQIVPASAPVFVSIDSDLSSDQWKSVQSLLDKFPAKDLLLGQLQQSFEKDADGVTWNDVKAALGPELDVAVLALRPSATVVGLTQPSDEAKFDALVSKINANAKTSGDRIVVADYQGWKVFSDSLAKVNAFKQAADAGTSLADDSNYKAATAKLADSSLVQVYANGAQLPTTMTGAVQGLVGSGKLAWAAAELVSQDDGLKVDGFAEREGGSSQTPANASKLLDVVPSGALVFLSFDGSALKTATLQNAVPQMKSVPQAGAVLEVLGKLDAVFGAQNALYVLPGAGIPEVTLVTEPDSPQQAEAAVQDVLTEYVGSSGAQPRSVTIDGVQAKELNLGRISIFWGVQDGRLVVTDSQEAFSELGSSGQKLADDPTFKEAQDAAGLPSTTAGLLYVNLKDSIPQVVGLAQLGGATIPPQVADNLRPLRTLIGWSAMDGSQTSGTLFLEVK
jgi:hypothetical protein